MMDQAFADIPYGPPFFAFSPGSHLADRACLEKTSTCPASQEHFLARSHRFSTTDLVAGSHTCRMLSESSTLNVLTVFPSPAPGSTPAEPEILRKGLETDDVRRGQTGLLNAGNLDGAGDSASWTRAQIIFAIAIAEAVAGDGASCTGAQIFFAIAVADRPEPAWAIIYLDALYDL